MFCFYRQQKQEYTTIYFISPSPPFRTKINVFVNFVPPISPSPFISRPHPHRMLAPLHLFQPLCFPLSLSRPCPFYRPLVLLYFCGTPLSSSHPPSLIPSILLLLPSALLIYTTTLSISCLFPFPSNFSRLNS